MLSPPPAAAQPVTVPLGRPVAGVVDGVVNPGEYAGTFTDPVTGIAVSWVHDDVNLSVGLVSPGTGWAGIGVGPEGGLERRALAPTAHLPPAAAPGSLLRERAPAKIPTRRPSLGLEGLGEIREAANVTPVARLLGD